MESPLQTSKLVRFALTIYVPKLNCWGVRVLTVEAQPPSVDLLTSNPGSTFIMTLCRRSHQLAKVLRRSSTIC